MEEKLGIKGWFILKHIRNGIILDERVINNLVVSAGLAQVAGLILTDVGGTAFDYIALGTGTTAAVAGDTALETEITSGGGSRISGTGTRTTTSVTNDTAQLVVNYTFTSTFALTESGIFNASSAGTMLSRQVFAAVNVKLGDVLQITWKIQLST